MTIYKCDICKKVIKDEYVSAGYGFPMPQYSFCLSCGKSIVNFLKKHKLVDSGERK